MSLWVTWSGQGSSLSHRVTVSGVAPNGAECYRTRCGKRVYVELTLLERVNDDLRCKKCAARKYELPPPVGAWSRVRRFDPVDTEEL